MNLKLIIYSEKNASGRERENWNEERKKERITEIYKYIIHN